MKEQWRKPLSGLRVIELGQNLAAPFASSILADLGAEVLKIEKPEGGDDARSWGPPFWHEDSALFNYLNRDKESRTVDLKNRDDLNWLLKQLESTDVFIHNLRPGVVDKLGISATDLHKVNPRLIYAAIGAFGNAGPLCEKPAYELLMQAFSGLMSLTGELDGSPVRVGPSICDLGSGMWLVIGILVGLLRRQTSGVGVTIDTSLYETALVWTGVHLANLVVSGEEPGRQGTGHPQISPYQLFETADGPVIIAAGNDRLFVKFADVLGHPEWVQDPRFSTNNLRVSNRPALIAMIAPLIAEEGKEFWIKRLGAAGIPCASVNNLSEVVDHPQTKALGIMQTPAGGFPMAALPISFDGVRPQIRHSAPLLGERETAPDGVNQGLSVAHK